MGRVIEAKSLSLRARAEDTPPHAAGSPCSAASPRRNVAVTRSRIVPAAPVAFPEEIVVPPTGRAGRPMRTHKVRALAAGRPHFYAYVVAPEPYVVRTPIGHLSGLSRGPGIP
jgi:hypothetical protein